MLGGVVAHRKLRDVALIAWTVRLSRKILEQLFEYLSQRIFVRALNAICI
jgi:hypothetical protein